MSDIVTITNYFHNEFKHSDVAKSYVKSRGISKDIAIQFKIGYAPPEPKYAKRFNNRIIFPIWDQQGTEVGWTGRTLVRASAKYVNVKESALFKKSRLLYGYNFAIESMYKTKAAILCEGQTDIVTMCQFGITNAVASSGVTSFKTAAACLLSRYATRIYIVFDADEAGEIASLAAEKYLREVGVTDIIPVTLPKNEDPASILTKYGKNYYLGLLDVARKNRKT